MADLNGASGRSGAAVLEALSELPGGPELLELAGATGDVALVGGATRDLLLGRRPRELDVVVGGDVATLARELSARLRTGERRPAARDSAATLHERFRTASVSWEGGRIDMAARRAESYAAPGALPDVREGSVEQDLARRDFTINAIAVPLAGPGRGELQTVPHALEDLRHGLIRVLHPDSFIDDPTRLLRLARYRARLGFEVEEETARLAAGALSTGALDGVSGARIGAELRLALAEPDPVPALHALDELGVLGAFAPSLALDEPLALGALAEAPSDATVSALLLGALILAGDRRGDGAGEPSVRELLDRLDFTAAERNRALRTAHRAPLLLAAMRSARRPSQLLEAIGDAPVEAIVLAGALGEGDGEEPVRAAVTRWLDELRHVRLSIGGEDLLAAGLPAGPDLGRRLKRVLEMRLDGELDDTPGQQLKAALATEDAT
jgi:tRNA nucleotidyltransferase (CCA-adding enzyme)